DFALGVHRARGESLFVEQSDYLSTERLYLALRHRVARGRARRADTFTVNQTRNTRRCFRLLSHLDRRENILTRRLRKEAYMLAEILPFFVAKVMEKKIRGRRSVFASVALPVLLSKGRPQRLL